jgi:ribosomal protein S27E
MERYGPPLNSVQCPACGARLGCDPRQGEAVPVACFICGQAIP